MPLESAYATFYLPLICNFGRISYTVYRAMHFSAKRCIAIALSVRLSVGEL